MSRNARAHDCSRAGTQESLHETLAHAVDACPRSIVLWLMRAKEQWLAGDVPAARSVLEQAHSHNPDSEELFLAAFKLEFENAEPERARVIAQRAKDSLSAPSDRVWLKAALVARELGNDAVRCAFLWCLMPLHTCAC
jgi:pre-mRNA-processing factor 6